MFLFIDGGSEYMNSILQESIEVYQQCDQLYSPEEVERACDRLAAEITQAMSSMHPLVLCVMNGGLIPTGKLLTRMDFPLQQEYIHATRYRGNTSGSTEIEWKIRPGSSLRGRNVLLIDDIHDEGLTLEAIRHACLEMGAARVYTAVLVNKVHDRKNGTAADFSGLDVPDRYVFGCGMDYKSYWRNAPGIYAVKDND